MSGAAGRIGSSSRRRPLGTIAMVLLLAGCASSGAAGRIVADPVARDHRIYDVRQQAFIGLTSLADELREVDVVLFGELHDDRVTHRVQVELFDLLSRDRRGVLGMEMFERDVQTVLDRQLGGSLRDPDFLRESRAWPNYASDYWPVVDLARERGWEFVATNLPQRHASAIAREGLRALDALAQDEWRWVAGEIECPQDAYWTRFIEAMNEGADSAANAAAHSIDEAALRRTYQAQCARDETMAESIVMRLDSGPVFHINGSFHSDHHLGIVPRLLRRAPGLTVRVISAVPVDGLSDPPIEENRGRADYLVFTRE